MSTVLSNIHRLPSFSAKITKGGSLPKFHNSCQGKSVQQARDTIALGKCGSVEVTVRTLLLMLLILYEHLELLGRSGLLNLKLSSGDFMNLVCGRALYIRANFFNVLYHYQITTRSTTEMCKGLVESVALLNGTMVYLLSGAKSITFAVLRSTIHLITSLSRADTNSVLCQCPRSASLASHCPP